MMMANKLLSKNLNVLGTYIQRGISSHSSILSKCENVKKLSVKNVSSHRFFSTTNTNTNILEKVASQQIMINGVKVDSKSAIGAGIGLALMLLLGGTSSNEKKVAHLEQSQTNTSSESTLKSETITSKSQLESVITTPESQSNETASISSLDDIDSIIKNLVNSLSNRLEHIEQQIFSQYAKNTQRAFVFIKPHAYTSEAIKLAREHLQSKGLNISREGDLKAKQIDERKLIDTHYGAIASKAVELDPKDLSVPEKGKKEFEKMFGETWEDALKSGKVFNAAQACEKLNVDGQGLDNLWSKLERGKNLLKFGGGFYCGKLKDDMYVINGFYMAMKERYTTEPAAIHYFVVEWDPRDLSWSDFRSKVLGATNPHEAESGSLRKSILAKWKDLKLPAEPDTGDNGVHASASPFEAMCERINWLGASLDQDPFARGLLWSKIDAEKLKKWMKDPQVKVGDKKVSLFDFVEDTDSEVCFDMLTKLNEEN